MPGGISINVMNRLWRLLSFMIDGKPRAKLASLMNYSNNAALSADLLKLRQSRI